MNTKSLPRKFISCAYCRRVLPKWFSPPQSRYRCPDCDWSAVYYFCNQAHLADWLADNPSHEHRHMWVDEMPDSGMRRIRYHR
jgi:hypothetical protein